MWGSACGVLGGWLQRVRAAFLCRGFTGGGWWGCKRVGQCGCKLVGGSVAVLTTVVAAGVGRNFKEIDRTGRLP